MALLFVWYDPSKNTIEQVVGDRAQLRAIITRIENAHTQQEQEALYDDPDRFAQLCTYFPINNLKSIATRPTTSHIVDNDGSFSLYFGGGDNDAVRMFIGDKLLRLES